MQGKLCHPENECEPPPEFVFLAFDGKIVQDHGKKKVSKNDITDIFFISYNSFLCLPLWQTLHTYPEVLCFRNYDANYPCLWKGCSLNWNGFSNFVFVAFPRKPSRPCDYAHLDRTQKGFDGHLWSQWHTRKEMHARGGVWEASQRRRWTVLCEI